MPSLEKRLWAKVDKQTGPWKHLKLGRCWVWTGSCMTTGYGQISLGGKKDRHTIGTHRVSWELQNGPIPEGLFVCHKCDVRLCVRPTHLFLGTQADNLADMAAKGRSTKGSTNGYAKLTEQDVLEIRRRWAEGGVLQRELGAEYGVTYGAISVIVLRKVWKHV